MLQAEAHHIVTARDFGALLSFIDAQVADGRRVRRGAVREALQARYRRQPPAVRQGVAIPHAAVRHLPRTRLVYAAHEPGIALGSDPAQRLHESMTLLVRYPPAPADHALLQELQQPHVQALLLPLFRAGDTAGVVSALSAVATAGRPGYAGEALPSLP